MTKIIRSICLFTKEPNQESIKKLNNLKSILTEKGFIIQTKRVCSPQESFSDIKEKIKDDTILLSVGSLNYDESIRKFDDFIINKNVAFNLNLTNVSIEDKHSNVLFNIIKQQPSSTFFFTYTFNSVNSSPYFPSANYERDGFSIGMQPTDLAGGCKTLEEWFEKMRICWEEINKIFEHDKDFLGIDSSIAPLLDGKSSLINFIKKMFPTFNDSILTDTYLKITKFIKESNPNPIGLCGLMLPCLEDFELADEYEKGEFSIERNAFLSLHSGLGIDTYPIGIDEKIKKVTNILKTVQGLSKKYNKPLSVRFVSDGLSKIGEETKFENQYLKDVVVRKL